VAGVDWADPAEPGVRYLRDTPDVASVLVPSAD
jgi:hypothetical protein